MFTKKNHLLVLSHCISFVSFSKFGTFLAPCPIRFFLIGWRNLILLFSAEVYIDVIISYHSVDEKILKSVFLFIEHIMRFFCSSGQFHIHSIILFNIWYTIDPNKTTRDYQKKKERKYDENPPHIKSGMRYICQLQNI